MKFQGALALLLLSACAASPQPMPSPSPTRPPEVMLSSDQMSATLGVSQINKIRAIDTAYMGFKVATYYRPDYLVVVYCSPNALCAGSTPTWEHPHFAFELANTFGGTPSETVHPTDNFAIVFPARATGKQVWCWPQNVGYLYDDIRQMLGPLSLKLQQAEPRSHKQIAYTVEDKTFWCKTIFS